MLLMLGWRGGGVGGGGGGGGGVVAIRFITIRFISRIAVVASLIISLLEIGFLLSFVVRATTTVTVTVAVAALFLLRGACKDRHISLFYSFLLSQFCRLLSLFAFLYVVLHHVYD